MTKPVAIIGYGGHGYIAVEILRNHYNSVDNYTDLVEKSYNPFKLSYLGNYEISTVSDRLQDFLCFIAIGNNAQRKEVFDYLSSKNLTWINAIHPKATVSTSVKIGTNIMIGAGSMINALTIIEDGAILNTGCIIEHECKIGAFSHIASGSVLCGNVSIGEKTLIGASSVIKPGITIGANSIIGIGSVVVDNIPDQVIAVGNPCRILKKNEIFI